MTSHNKNLESIWKNFNRELFNFILSKVKDRDAAKDILQETFIKIQKNIHSLKDDKSLKFWIYRITYNSIIDYFRSKKILKEFDDNSENTAQSDSDGLNENNLKLSECVVPFINKLPPIYKEALTLTEFENYSQLELADHLGISYSGAKSRVQRAKVKLKELFEDCCNISYDKYGNIIEYHSRTDKKSC
ncbi:MAG TPA: RNA polymerase sigma factor SigZ [Ignavibacteria bacterium]|nr:RNA polymerase sigma factor SigZ [Ignavibacteria bacterium]HMR39817.1 RNA polymerase sigma factor SigZ [Ignavibacteria bacterium]